VRKAGLVLSMQELLASGVGAAQMGLGLGRRERAAMPEALGGGSLMLFLPVSLEPTFSRL
jgi:hypothetical protein